MPAVVKAKAEPGLWLEQVPVPEVGGDDVLIRALAFDANYLADGYVAVYGVWQRTYHHRQTVNVLYSDGHAVAIDNHKDPYTVDARSDPRNSFAKILEVFEALDKMP